MDRWQGLLGSFVQCLVTRHPQHLIHHFHSPYHLHSLIPSWIHLYLNPHPLPNQVHNDELRPARHRMNGLHLHSNPFFFFSTTIHSLSWISKKNLLVWFTELGFKEKCSFLFANFMTSLSLSCQSCWIDPSLFCLVQVWSWTTTVTGLICIKRVLICCCSRHSRIKVGTRVRKEGSEREERGKR